jgi:hypothetical protein
MAWIRTQAYNGVDEDEFDKNLYELEADNKITREKSDDLRKQFRDTRKDIEKRK